MMVMRKTVMFSMVEMPRVIFSPDSAGIRNTNLTIKDRSEKIKIWRRQCRTVHIWGDPIIEYCITTVFVKRPHFFAFVKQIIFQPYRENNDYKKGREVAIIA